MKLIFEGSLVDILAQAATFAALGSPQPPLDRAVPATAEQLEVPAFHPSITETSAYWRGLGDSKQFLAFLLVEGPGFVPVSAVRSHLGELRGMTAGPRTRWNAVFHESYDYPFRLVSVHGVAGYIVTNEIVDLFRRAVGDELEQWASRN